MTEDQRIFDFIPCGIPEKLHIAFYRYIVPSGTVQEGQNIVKTFLTPETLIIHNTETKLHPTQNIKNPFDVLYFCLTLIKINRRYIIHPNMDV